MSNDDYGGASTREIADALGLTHSERHATVSNKMTPVALHMLVECYYMGTDLTVGPTAARRGAANFLIRAGLVRFRDAQVPTSGLEMTARGRLHVDRLVLLPILQAPQEEAQNGPGEAAPRYLWGYASPALDAVPMPHTAAEALNHMCAAQGQLSNPMASSIFLEALTWDQQTRVLERLGWRVAP